MGIKSILLWLPMIAIAFGNALLRELVFLKHYRELPAHQLSTVTLAVLCAIYTWLVFPLLNIQHAKQAFLTGAAWVLLTVAFEFSLGRLTNRSWKYLLRDYDLFAGHIWPVFLFCLFMLPYLFYVLKKGTS